VELRRKRRDVRRRIGAIGARQDEAKTARRPRRRRENQDGGEIALAEQLESAELTE
jgi:hypothetical protein